MTTQSEKKEINHCSTCTGGEGPHRGGGADQNSPQTGLTRSQSRREAVEERGCAVNAGGADGDAGRQRYLGEEDLAV